MVEFAAVEFTALIVGHPMTATFYASMTDKQSKNARTSSSSISASPLLADSFGMDGWMDLCTMDCMMTLSVECPWAQMLIYLET